MSLYGVLVGFHIFLLAAWIGMDAGQFVSSFFTRDPKLSPESRWVAGRISTYVGLGPRTAFPLILATGLLLAYTSGLGFQDVPLWLIVLAEVAALLWVWALWQQFFTLQAKLAGRAVGWRSVFDREFRTFDRVIRFVIGGVMLVVATTSLIGLGPISVSWVAIKVVLFAIVLIESTITRIVTADYPVALAEIAQHGSSPEREARLNLALRHAYPLVLADWAIGAVIVLVATIRPF